MNEALAFFNPMRRLGFGKNSIFLPILGSILVLTLVELIATHTQISPNSASAIIISSSILLVVYFSFRDGIRGGILSAGIVFLYYTYVIFTRVKMPQREAGIQSAIFLTGMYIAIGLIIGWLKQSIDQLILKEKNARLLVEEERLRLKNILEHLPIAIRIVDVKEKKIEWNKKLEELLKKKFGGNFESDVRYIAEHELRNGHTLNVNDLILMKSLKSKKKINASEIEYLRDDKKKLLLKINASPIFNKNRQLTSVVSVLSDVTLEREMQERKNTFINMASHELRTPLTSMKLYLNLLFKRSQEINNNSLSTLISNLILQTERLQQLASDLLDASRIQTGKLHFEKQEFLLNELIFEVGSLFEEVRHDKKIIVKNAKPILVNADRFRIYQVLTNLITNAIKYSDKGDKIIIQSKRIDGAAEVSVKDFGIGIEEGKKNKVFDRLYQIKDGHDRTYPGLGMGLFISKEIIKKHKGKIWVESQKGKGSTFRFTIPLSG